MKAQHLLLTTPLALTSITPTSASVSPTITTTQQQAFVSPTTLHDSESSINSHPRIQIEHLLDEGGASLQRFNSLHTSPISIEEAQSAHGIPWSDIIGKSNKDDPLLYMPFWEWQM